MIRNIIALLFCLLSFTAFSQEGRQKNQYLGLDKNAVIEKLGQPTVTKKATGDSETLIYIFKQTNEAAPNRDKSNIKEEKMHMYSFTLDKSGKVTDWKERYQ